MFSGCWISVPGIWVSSVPVLSTHSRHDNIDGLLMERHLAKKARRSGKHHLKGPPKRTEEDDKRFAESFEKLIIQVEGEANE